MRAEVRVAVERRGGRNDVVERSAQAPISVRRCGSRVLLASSAATPVGGDALDIAISVGPAAHADVGSVAAMMVWPGPTHEWSSTDLVCEVACGADLVWWPEPTVSVVGSQHRASTLVRLASDATCTIVDELALGRTGEASGRLDLDLRIERGGVVLVHHQEAFGPDVTGALSSVSVGAARFCVSAVIVGVATGGSRTDWSPHGAAAWLPVADDAVAVMAGGADRPSVWRLLDVVAPELLRRGASPRPLTMVRPSDHFVGR